MSFLFNLLFFVWGFTLPIFAQGIKPHFLVNVGYAHQNENSVSIGPELYFVYKNNQITSLNVNGVYDLSNSRFFPEVNVSHRFNVNFLNPYSQNIKSNFFSLGTSGSKYYIRPEFGLNFLDIITLKTGYNFSIDKEEIYKGMVYGINLHIPLVLF